MIDRARWMRNEAKLEGIEPKFRARFEGVVKRLESAGFRPLVVETRRSLARQAVLRARGLSRVFRGKHQAGLAMDIISDNFTWAATPPVFMATLAFAAREEGLVTGLAWEMEPTKRALIERRVMQGTITSLTIAINDVGHGFDPCHVEVK